jgi:formylglycine-generating enzyme required for sulfatase activity
MRFRRILAGVAAVCAGVVVLSCGNNGSDNPTGPTETPPRAPTDLQTVRTAPGEIQIAWRDNSTDELGFRIERSVGGAGQFAQIDTVARNVATYVDAGLTAGLTYFYRVRSYTPRVASDPSDAVYGIAAVNVSPTVPIALDPPNRARDVETGPVTLQWTATDGDPGDALLYDVYYGSVRNDLRLILDGTTATSAAVPDPVVLNAHYFWKVVVRDPKGAMGVSPIWSFSTRVERVVVPEGWLVMGEPDLFPHPGNPVRVESFEMDRYEVTNQQLADFLNEALRTDPPLVRTSGGGVYDPGGVMLYAQTFEADDDALISYERADSLFLVLPGREAFPATEVTWEGALLFAQYYGRRLPTEAEWEMAARGNGTEYGTETFQVPDTDSTFVVVEVGVGRTYPWGNEPDNSRANFLGSGDPYEGQGRVPSTPVGFFDGQVHGGFQTNDGSSPFGIQDLAGNVNEWCLDWFAPYRNPHSPPAFGTLRVIRGGSWNVGRFSIETWRRNFALPGQPGDAEEGADHTIGFRTVRSVP